MRDILKTVLDNYVTAKSEEFAAHPFADFLRTEAVAKFEENTGIDKNLYKIEGSPGKGRWADVPWIAVFDKEITTTATKGYYIVYLFCADMSGVYVSLNQGWTYFEKKYKAKDGKNKIQIAAKAWQSILSSGLGDFSFNKIDLKGISKHSDLAEGYELGHICGKYYDLNQLPNDNTLKNDLVKLMGVYRELKGKLLNGSVEETNNHLIVNCDLGLIETHEKKEESETINLESIIEQANNTMLTLDSIPPNQISTKEVDDAFKARKTDFFKKAKNQKKLGYAGELMVLKYERDCLIAAGKHKLAEQIRHVSKEDGDGAGYDILSFESNGNPKYIEVKTTTQDKDSPFVITANELKFSEINANNYKLYRIYNFDAGTATGTLYILNGDISKILDLKAQQFLAIGIL